MQQSMVEIASLRPALEVVRMGPFQACAAYLRGDISADDYQKVIREYPKVLLVVTAIAELARLQPLSKTTPAIRDLTVTLLDYEAMGQMCLSHLLSSRVAQDASATARETRVYCADVLRRQFRLRRLAALR